MSKLRPLLHRQMHQAFKTPGLAQRRALPGGLRIDILVHHGLVRLQLSRAGQAPSLAEWKTVLKHLPYDTPLNLEPRAFRHDGRRYLAGSWSTIQPPRPLPEREPVA